MFSYSYTASPFSSQWVLRARGTGRQCTLSQFSIRVIILILSSYTMFGDDLFCISSDHPNQGTDCCRGAGWGLGCRSLTPWRERTKHFEGTSTCFWIIFKHTWLHFLYGQWLEPVSVPNQRKHLSPQQEVGQKHVKGAFLSFYISSPAHLSPKQIPFYLYASPRDSMYWEAVLRSKVMNWAWPTSSTPRPVGPSLTPMAASSFVPTVHCTERHRALRSWNECSSNMSTLISVPMIIIGGLICLCPLYVQL